MVRQRQAREIPGPEPAKIVVLLGRGVDGLPVPARDEERVHLEGGVADRHGDRSRVVDVDAELLPALPRDRVDG